MAVPLLPGVLAGWGRFSAAAVASFAATVAGVTHTSLVFGLFGVPMGAARLIADCEFKRTFGF